MQEMIARHQQDLTEVKERQLEEKNQLENRYTQIVENLKKHIDELKNSHNDYREQSEQAKTGMAFVALLPSFLLTLCLWANPPAL